jgi:hypothetical protein
MLTRQSIRRLVRDAVLWLVLPLLIVTSIVLLIGNDSPARAWLQAPGWSRATPIADTAINAAVPLALDAQGRIYLFVLERRAQDLQPVLIAVDRDGAAAWRQPLDMRFAHVEQPQLAWADDQLWVFWLGDGSLYQAVLARDGSLRSPSAGLSAIENVRSLSVARDPAGRLAVWFGSDVGLYAVDPQHTAAPQLIDRQGDQPALAYDQQGRLHAAWLRRDAPAGERFMYAVANQAGAADAVPLLEPGAALGERLLGPWLGVDSSHAYLFWTIQPVSQEYAGRLRSQYLSFPLADPAARRAEQSLRMPREAGLDYNIDPGDLLSGPRAAPAAGSGSVPTALTINAQAAGELVIAAQAAVRYKYQRSAFQVGTIYLRDGEVQAYQLLSFSDSGGFRPAIISDTAGQLYLSYLEPAAPGFHVYLAATAPDLRTALAGVQADDLRRMLLDTVFGMVLGIIFSPLILLLWLLAPLALLGLSWGLRRNAGSPGAAGNLLSLGPALFAYWAAKLYTFAGALSYVPFSSWIPVLTEWLAWPLRIAVPAAIAGLAIGLAWRITRRQGDFSALAFFLIYAGIDGLLNLAIYGGLLSGEFYPI